MTCCREREVEVERERKRKRERETEERVSGGRVGLSRSGSYDARRGV